MVDERNPTFSGTSNQTHQRQKKQVDSFIPPSDASKSNLSNPHFTHHSNHPDSIIYYATAHEVWEDLPYSSVCQEEKQRLRSETYTAAESNSSAAMAVKSNQMKNNFVGNARIFHGATLMHLLWGNETLCREVLSLHGYPPRHPKARTSSNFNRHKNTSMANQVSDGANKDDGKLVLTGISEAQLQQLLSLLNDKNGGSGYEEDNWFG
ncbi:hypothetical protein CK203_038483 [Vitis vinifera]|uniref:Uncharacterized protein n=1 Tax=Vitis vinifera TaxID=29760 RepID=A0A438IRZ5_VITVI|nr:hypothetical protein CK203_038483 [Vitis vinifera]